MGSLAPGLSRKLKKVLDSNRTDSPDLLASLAALSSFYHHNTPHSRRNLRSTIENRALSINHEFLSASAAALSSLDRVEAEVDALASCCDTIAGALSSCAASTGDIVSATERLRRELEVAGERQRIVAAFLREFQLSAAEVRALREEEVGEGFFEALRHVHHIHSNCKVLLRTHHQRAGLELMDIMALHQEAAYERLCRWVQTECRKLGDSDNPEVPPLLKRAVAWLRERPVLFKYCTEEVANMRHNSLFRRFIGALTRGGPGGVPRPIEVHAHDPLRYVGDMLGWLHQALASEREFVASLLGDDLEKIQSDLEFVLDRVFQGVCRPFKARVDQVFQSQPGIITSYKLTNTLDFYTHTISALLGTEAALFNTLVALEESAQKTFFEILKIRGEKLLRHPPPVAVDLSPPVAVREAVSLLLEIIETHEAMLVSASAQKPDFGPVISALLDPIIQMCELAAEAHRSKGTSSQRSSVDALLSKVNGSSSQIFLVNCLCAMQQPLAGREVAGEYAKKLGDMIEERLQILVQTEVDGILAKCGLLEKMHLFAGAGPLSQMEETSEASLSECLKSFFHMILGSEASLPEFEQVQVPKLRSEASVRVARSLAQAYQDIYESVSDPKNGYADPKSLARHPPNQIRTILGI